MDLKKLEFNMINQLIDGTSYSITDDYSISLIDDGIMVKLRNKDLTINLDKIVVFQATKLNGTTYKFQIKSEYLRFDDPRFIQESYLYKRLFGYSMNANYKRMLIFLGSLSKTETVQYMQMLDQNIQKSIRKFFEAES